MEDQTLADAYASILGELAFAATSDAGADAVSSYIAVLFEACLTWKLE